MKVKILRNLGKDLKVQLGNEVRDVKEGDTVDLKQETADKLIKAGLAEAVK